MCIQGSKIQYVDAVFVCKISIWSMVGLGRYGDSWFFWVIITVWDTLMFLKGNIFKGVMWVCICGMFLENKFSCVVVNVYTQIEKEIVVSREEN